MSISKDRIERAMIAAEYAARSALLKHDIVVKGIVLTVAMDCDGAQIVVASQVMNPVPQHLARSLHDSAVEAGWSD